ncbi:MAG: hypothetical protein H7Y88_12735 [Phycisphaerales bacterium]|nr:hypothetical protein [Phycisphaerales bacterium]
MATRSARNNILAGAFVLGSIILGLAVIILLSGISEKLTPTTKYTIQFSLSDGAEGLDAGSRVKVGGRPAGRVTGWSFARDPQTQAPTGIDVRLRIRSDINLYETTTALLVLPLLGTGASINIPDIGAAPTGRKLTAGETLRGHVAPPGFLAQAGYGPEQSRQVQNFIANVEKASEKVLRISERAETEFDPLLAQIRQSIDDVNAITADARSKWPEWSGEVDSTLANLNEASGRLGPFFEETDAAIADARQVVADVDSIIADNRPHIDSALANIDELTQKANTEGWEAVRTLLAKAEGGVDDFADTAERLNTLLREQSPQIRTLMANARLASEQLKLTTVEVRAAPWKLLNPPTGRKELENEALFDAARAYASAVSDLRAVTASLEALAGDEHSQPVILSGDDAAALAEQLQHTLSQYQEEEKRFLLKLRQNKP